MPSLYRRTGLALPSLVLWHEIRSTKKAVVHGYNCKIVTNILARSTPAKEGMVFESKMENQANKQQAPADRNVDDEEGEAMNSSCCADLCGFATYPFQRDHPSDEDMQGTSSSSSTCAKKATATKKDDEVTSLAPPRSRADTEPLTPEKRPAVSEVQRQQQGGSTSGTSTALSTSTSSSSSSPENNNNDDESNKNKEMATFGALSSSRSKSNGAVAMEKPAPFATSSSTMLSRSLLDDLEHVDERVAEREQVVEAEAHKVVLEQMLEDAAAEEASRVSDGGDDREAQLTAVALLEKNADGDAYGIPSDEEGKAPFVVVENAEADEAKIPCGKEPVSNNSVSNPTSDQQILCYNTDEKSGPSSGDKAHPDSQATVDDYAKKQKSVADSAISLKPNLEEQVPSDLCKKPQFSTTEETPIESKVPAGDDFEKQPLEKVPACYLGSSNSPCFEEQGPSDEEEKPLLGPTKVLGDDTEKRTVDDDPECTVSISKSFSNFSGEGEISNVATFSHGECIVNDELSANAPAKEDDLPNDEEQNRSSDELELLSRRSSGSNPYLSADEHSEDAFEAILGLRGAESDEDCDTTEKEEFPGPSVKPDEKLVLDLVDNDIDSKMQAIHESRSREETEEGQSAIRSAQRSTVEKDMGAAIVTGNEERSPIDGVESDADSEAPAANQPENLREINDKNRTFEKTDEAIDSKILSTKSHETEEKMLDSIADKETIDEVQLVEDDHAPGNQIEYDEFLPAPAHLGCNSNLANNTVDQSVGNDQSNEAFGEVSVQEGCVSSSEAIIDTVDAVAKSFDSEKNEQVSISGEEVVHLGNVNDTIDALTAKGTTTGFVPSEEEDDGDAIFEPEGMNESFLQQEKIDEVPLEEEQNTLIEKPADEDPFVVSEDPIADVSVEAATMLDEASENLQNLSTVEEESIKRSHSDSSQKDEEAVLPTLSSDWRTANPQDSPVEISTETEEGNRVTDLVDGERAGRGLHRKVDSCTVENEETAAILDVEPPIHAAHQADGIRVDDPASLGATLSSSESNMVTGENVPCRFVGNEQSETSTIEDLTETNDTESRLDENPALHAKQAQPSTGVAHFKSIFAGEFDPVPSDPSDDANDDKSTIEMQDETLSDSIVHLGDINEAMDVTQVDDESSDESCCLEKVASLVKSIETSEFSEVRPAVGVTATRSLTPIHVLGSKPDRDDSAGSDPLGFHETITSLPKDEDETCLFFEDPQRLENSEITSISMLYDDESKKQKTALSQSMLPSTNVYYKASPFAFEDDDADNTDVHSVPRIPQIEKFASDLKQEAAEIICVNRSVDSADVLSVRSELEAYFPGVMKEWEVQEALRLAKENFQPVLAELEQHFVQKRQPVNNWILMGTVTLFFGLLKLTSLMHEKSMDDDCSNPDFLELRLRIIDYEV